MSQPQRQVTPAPRGVALACAALVAAPFLVAVVSVVGRHWFPSSDWAFELLDVRRVGTGHTPLVGVVSRFGWRHPGPWIFYVLAPFVRLGGTTAALVGAGLVGAAWAAATVLLFARRASAGATVLLSLLLLVLARSFGPDTLVDPWNPWMAFWPFVGAVVALWLVAERDRVAVPWVVVAGTLAIQAHVSYAPLLGGLALVAVALAALGHRPIGSADAADAAGPETSAGSWRRPVLLGAVLGVLLWVPPVVQQLTAHPGNVGELVRYFGSPKEPTSGWHLAWLTVGAELRSPPPWVTGHDAGPIGYVDLRSMQQGIVLVLVVAVLGVLAWRRGHRAVARFAALAVASVPVAILAISRITGLIATYLVRWTWALGGLLWLSLLWSAGVLARPLLDRVVGARRLPAAAAVGAVALVAVLVPVQGGRARVPKEGLSEVVGRLSTQTARTLPRGRTYLLTGRDPFTFDAVMNGVGVELLHRGFQVRVASRYGDSYGRWLVARPGATLPVLVVVASVDGRTATSAPAGAHELARADPLTPALRHEQQVLEQRIAAVTHEPVARVQALAGNAYGQSVLRGTGATAADVSRMTWFVGRGAAYAVYVVEP